MKAITKITPADWMLLPACEKIMGVLNQGFQEPQALFVGGCVRNLLLGVKTADLDIATKHTPEKVKELCEKARFKVIPTGIEHGTNTIVVDDQVFEVTTLRQDVATDGRRATVAFSDSWLADAMRRDFTVNTLLAGLNGQIYDPTGKGYEDIENRKIVFVGDPEQRIKEDFLRILRFFRFHAYYGEGEPNKPALEACKKLADNIPKLSRERISQEFFKILEVDSSHATMSLMRDNNVLREVIDLQLAVLSVLIERQTKYNLRHLRARLYFLMGANLRKLEVVSEQYFIFTNSQKKFFQKLDYALNNASYLYSPKELAYREGIELAQQIILAKYEEDILPQALNQLAGWHIPHFPLSGDDALHAGIPQGKQIGIYLKQTEDWWISKDFVPDKQALLKYMQGLLG